MTVVPSQSPTDINPSLPQQEVNSSVSGQVSLSEASLAYIPNLPLDRLIVPPLVPEPSQTDDATFGQLNSVRGTAETFNGVPLYGEPIYFPVGNVPPGTDINLQQLNDSWRAYRTGGQSVQGHYISSLQGERDGRYHRGIDITGDPGDPIRAISSGEVIFAGFGNGSNGYSGYGNVVVVRHRDGRESLYAHNLRNLVRTGQQVTAGQQIAELGSTGHSTGPHSHFELYNPNGQLVMLAQADYFDSGNTALRPITSDYSQYYLAALRGEVALPNGRPSPVNEHLAHWAGWLRIQYPALADLPRVPPSTSWTPEHTQFFSALANRLQLPGDPSGSGRVISPATVAAMLVLSQEAGHPTFHAPVGINADVRQSVVALASGSNSTIAVRPAETRSPTPNSPGLATIDLQSAPVDAAIAYQQLNNPIGWDRSTPDSAALGQVREILRYVVTTVLPRYPDIQEAYPTLQQYERQSSSLFTVSDLTALQAFRRILARNEIASGSGDRFTITDARGFQALITRLGGPAPVPPVLPGRA